MSGPIPNHLIRSDVKKAYDTMAPTYTAWTQPTHETRLRYLKALLGALGEDETITVLELGCGAGVPCTGFMASRPNIKVTANDISDAQIALARQRLPPSVEIAPRDMVEWEFDVARFDGVVGMYSLFHLPRDEQTVMLRRIFWLVEAWWSIVGKIYGGRV